MAFVSPEYVQSIQKKHDFKVWRLYDSTGKVLINKSDGSGSIDDSIDDLQDAITNCIGDFVTVKLYSKPPNKSTEGNPAEHGLQLKVRLGGFGISAPQSRSGTNPTWMDMVAMQDRIRTAEMEKLRMELEQKEQSPLARIAERLMENDQLVNALAGLLMKLSARPLAATPTAIAQPPKTTDETITRLAAIDPDYQNTLSKMVSYLERNPGVIDQIKPIFEQ